MAPKTKRQREDNGSNSSRNKPPEWVGLAKLSTIERKWQAYHYKKKFQDLKNPDATMIGKRKIDLNDFRNFRLVESFERLGWLAALTFNNDDRAEVYMEEIIEWMSTLKKELGNNPPWTTQLIGSVKKTEVIMSMESLNTIADFDTLPEEQYETKSDAFVTCDGMNSGPVWNEFCPIVDC